MHQGGAGDQIIAARAVLKDWNSGKIPFFTEPPSQNQTSTTHFQEWAVQTKLDTIYASEQESVFSLLKGVDVSECTTFGEKSLFVTKVSPILLDHLAGKEEMEEEEEEGEEEDEDVAEDDEEEEDEEDQEDQDEADAKEVNVNEDFNFATDFVASNDLEEDSDEMDDDEDDDASSE